MLARVLICLLVSCGGILGAEAGLATIGDPWRYYKGTGEPSAPGELGWQSIDFDDSGWLEGSPEFAVFGGATPLNDMLGNYGSIYVRRTFLVEDPDRIRWLVLRIDYSDGFVAFLNGVEVARRNIAGEAGTSVPFNAWATGLRARGYPEEIDLTAFQALLRPGKNTLAIQAHTNGDWDFSVTPELLANFTRGPFIQNASTDAVQVIWKTSVPADSVVEYGTDENLGMRVEQAELSTHHVVTLSGLDPDTAYVYRVRSRAGEREAISEIKRFRTLKRSGSIRFAVLGDSGSGWQPQLQIARILREADPDLVLHAGDIIYPSFTTGLSDMRCLSVYRRHMESTPYYFTIGNHDLYSGPEHYLNAFSLPTNSVSLVDHAAARTTPEHYYSFDHGDAHFTVLFVPYIHQYKLQVGDTQWRWFTNDLATTTKPWKFLLFHVPMDTSGPHRPDDHNNNGLLDRLEIKEAVLPVASRYGVQLVFTGHDHIYERMNPTNGVHGIVTGGGGGGLYGFTELDVASVLFWSRYHCVVVDVDGDTLETQALGLHGEVFDRMTIQRALPPPRVYEAAWHTPQIESGPADDAQGNINGQLFDLIGAPIPTLTGKFSNLGRAYVNNDRTNVYIGLDRVMIYGNNNIFLFIEALGMPGVTNLVKVGNGIVDPEGQGADGLDFLSNLWFSNFTPGIGCILGDEMADGQFRSFVRSNLAFNIGQGVFRLNGQLENVGGVRLQQFNLSPQIGGALGEENANFIEVSIPFSQLGQAKPGDRIKLGAVVGGAWVDTNSQVRARLLDDGFLGAAMDGSATGQVRLQGVEVQLAQDPDPDNDGLRTEDESRRGTDPANADTDKDSLLDGWEVEHDLDPLSASGEEGRVGDPDGDGFSNYSEQMAGTDPRDAASALRLRLEWTGGDRFRITWPAVAGKRYQLQVSEHLLGGYRDLGGADFPVRAAQSVMQRYEMEVSGTGSRFYRLVLLP